ncbi:MAG: MopE-related protein [Saprospiraceae bacterium]
MLKLKSLLKSKRIQWLTSYLCAFLFLTSVTNLSAQPSIAREWNELLLEAIRSDFARPTVHARNLFHSSVAMYDAWAVYDETAETFFLGKTVDGFTCPFDGILPPKDLEIAREETMSYAVYRLLKHRFKNSPNAFQTLAAFDAKFIELGYIEAYTSTDYSSGNPAALGNYLGEYLINFGMQDGANEEMGYSNTTYAAINPPLITNFAGNPNLQDPNRWQPLTLSLFIDQAGNPIPFNTPPFLSPEWGQVSPFALSADDLTVYQRDGFDYWVYHDPGVPPYLNMADPTDALSEEYKWNFALVALWSAHMDPDDGVMWDISPGALGNIQEYPSTMEGLHDFFDELEGGDPSIGHPLNPTTGLPYETQMVPRGDYTRVLAEFWADGPESETPPGHWFTILNYVNDHPATEKRFRGVGPVIDDLEWDVKAYFAMGGAVHDAAISAWGVKGWYDYLRPISAVRSMADRGQSTDSNLPNYDPAGIPLYPGKIELVTAGDPLAGANGEHIDKIKVLAWRGPDYITNTATDKAGVGWILGENWWPYQRPTFVTPPFAGYVSGHSTFSRAAAEVMERLTGDAFFPGGMGEFDVQQNEFLVFEEGPSVSFTLQWATYRDASDQTSLSRIWGGIHPPVDDLPGRLMGESIGIDAFELAESYFYRDEDMDGVYNYLDCDDNDATSYPGAPELCDGKDNDCNGSIDDGLPLNTYYLDADNDGFGNVAVTVDTCLATAPAGYVANASDCDDDDNLVNEDAFEICDGIDNDCNGLIDDGLMLNSYYWDEDNDGYGNPAIILDTCLSTAPIGYVTNALDCDDNNEMINQDATEICDGIDNDCNGLVDDGLTLYRYYVDGDNDGYGNDAIFMDTCQSTPPPGFVVDFSDCDDNNPVIHPNARETADNNIDEDCTGVDLYLLTKLFPNPVRENLIVHYNHTGTLMVQIIDLRGRINLSGQFTFYENNASIDCSSLPNGVYIVRLLENDGKQIFAEKIIKN